MFVSKTATLRRSHSSVIMACSTSSFLLWIKTALKLGVGARFGTLLVPVDRFQLFLERYDRAVRVLGLLR